MSPAAVTRVFRVPVAGVLWFSVPQSPALGYAVKPMASTPTDEELMLCFQRGDAAAFDALYRRYRNPLMGFLRQRMGDSAQAEELFQDIWTSIIRRIGDYRVESSFRTYLFHNARNRLIDHYRRGRDTVTLDEVDDELLSSEHVDDAVDAQRRYRHLHAALQTLPDEQREAFLLKEAAGFSLQAVAEATGVTAETVKSRLRYAFRKLRLLLEDVS